MSDEIAYDSSPFPQAYLEQLQSYVRLAFPKYIGQKWCFSGFELLILVVNALYVYLLFSVDQVFCDIFKLLNNVLGCFFNVNLF